MTQKTQVMIKALVYFCGILSGLDVGAANVGDCGQLRTLKPGDSCCTKGEDAPNLNCNGNFLFSAKF